MRSKEWAVTAYCSLIFILKICVHRSDRLWIKDVTGVNRLWDERPWAIKIIDVVEEEEEEITIKAKRISLGRHKNIVQALIAQKAKENK